jgi:hypothetical protein
MACVHCRKQIKAFRTTNFAKDDPVRTHTQGVLDEIADGDCALAFKVGRAGFQRQPMRLLQAKFGSVFDCQHTFARIDHFRQGVKHSCLA